MTDRAAFLAAVRSTPRGADPGLPDGANAPDAPTELRAGETAIDRFQQETEAVSATVSRAGHAQAAAVVLGALQAEEARSVALTADLGSLLGPIRAGLVEAGLAVVDYAAVKRHELGPLDATVTGCIAAVAATGSIVTSAAGAGRAGAVIAPTHICLVREQQILPGLHALLSGSALADAGSLIALQSGPSRSADIEKTLILGVHGPGRVHVVIINDEGPSSLA